MGFVMEKHSIMQSILKYMENMQLTICFFNLVLCCLSFCEYIDLSSSDGLMFTFFADLFFFLYQLFFISHDTYDMRWRKK